MLPSAVHSRWNLVPCCGTLQCRENSGKPWTIREVCLVCVKLQMWTAKKNIAFYNKLFLISVHLSMCITQWLFHNGKSYTTVCFSFHFKVFLYLQSPLKEFGVNCLQARSIYWCPSNIKAFLMQCNSLWRRIGCACKDGKDESLWCVEANLPDALSYTIVGSRKVIWPELLNALKAENYSIWT